MLRSFSIILLLVLWGYCIEQSFSHISVHLAYLLIILGVGTIIYFIERKIKQKRRK